MYLTTSALKLRSLSFVLPPGILSPSLTETHFVGVFFWGIVKFLLIYLKMIRLYILMKKLFIRVKY